MGRDCEGKLNVESWPKLGGCWIKGSGQDEGINPRLGFLAHLPSPSWKAPQEGILEEGRA